MSTPKLHKLFESRTWYTSTVRVLIAILAETIFAQTITGSVVIAGAPGALHEHSQLCQITAVAI
eukprot:2234156-Amphidinium_carterae.1